MEKRVKKQQKQCGICLNKVTLRGSINCCHHIFCWNCIRRWARIQNTCPLCKKRFTKLHSKLFTKKYNLSRSKRSLIIAIQQKNQNCQEQAHPQQSEQVALGIYTIIRNDEELLRAFMQDQDLGFHLSDIES